ncbi:MAG: DNA polymerase I [Acetatifactor sp.]|nr:DNA polymerase I [Acetatifactor sp.]
MNKKLVLIDGHSILNRAYYGVPPLTNADGLHTNAVYGFLNIMFKILDEEKPDYLTVAFDVSAPTFRHKMYDEYKGTRKPMDPELKEQVPVIKDLLKAMNIVIVEQAGFEADDILGTLAKKAEADGLSVSLVSGDRDLLQIASDNIKICIPKTKGGRTEMFTYYAKDLFEEQHITPKQFIQKKALMGDTADNIPGVPKIGEVTAGNLIIEFGSIENLYANLDKISKKSVRESLENNRDLCDLSLKLATIKTDCDLQVGYEDAVAGDFFTPEAYVIFKKLGFKNYLAKFNSEERKNTETKCDFKLVDSCDEFVTALNKYSSNSHVGLHFVFEKKELRGIALCGEESETYFLNTCIDPEPVQMTLFDLLDDEKECKAKINSEDFKKVCEAINSLLGKVKLSVFDIKPAYRILDYENLENYFDVLIGAYLINPLKSDFDMETIADQYVSMTIPGYKEVFGKDDFETAFKNDPKKVSAFYGTMALVSFKSFEPIRAKLSEFGMEDLMKDIEMPLSYVLYDMEKEGVSVNRDALLEYTDSLKGRITELEDSIHEQAGDRDFNINSPKQLGEILFEKMGLEGGKKTKTGYSTAADVLEKLAPENPIISDILEYRTLTKLKSTYGEGLAECIAEDGRIHTNFNQTITATGRISSTEPNLQNIPMRMELGRRIRKVFVPKKGFVFMDADYSQVELRILAHMSGDEQLIEAYKSAQDIHRITASKVFNTPIDEVTDLQRRNAKAVNFGIVYGISSFGLSQDLSISRKEAESYIEQYFKTFPGIKKYLDETVEKAKKDGFVTTSYGRRRPIPELSQKNFMIRQFGERVAMNSPIQGTAADIMKIAMIKTWKRLKDEGLRSKILLQVHDELLIETAEDEVDKVREILTDSMQNAAELKVELKIDLHMGNDWFDAK